MLLLSSFVFLWGLIDIDSLEIVRILNKEPGKYLKNVIVDLEREIVYGNIKNDRDEICNYIKDKYLV